MEVTISVELLNLMVEKAATVSKDSVEVTAETLGALAGLSRHQVDRKRVNGLFEGYVRQTERGAYLYKLGDCIRLLKGAALGERSSTNTTTEV